jgi:YD repeat-containing protein
VQGYVANGQDPSLWVWDANENPPRWEKNDGTAIVHGTNNDQNVIVQVAYDLLGRRTSQRHPRGIRDGLRYDQLGRRITLTDPLSHTWQTAYEDANTGGAALRPAKRGRN